MTLAGSMTAGDLIAGIANFAYGAGLNWLMKRVLVALAPSSGQPSALLAPDTSGGTVTLI